MVPPSTANDLAGFALTEQHDFAYRKLVQDSGNITKNAVTCI